MLTLPKVTQRNACGKKPAPAWALLTSLTSQTLFHSSYTATPTVPRMLQIQFCLRVFALAVPVAWRALIQAFTVPSVLQCHLPSEVPHSPPTKPLSSPFFPADCTAFSVSLFSGTHVTFGHIMHLFSVSPNQNVSSMRAETISCLSTVSPKMSNTSHFWYSVK